MEVPGIAIDLAAEQREALRRQRLAHFRRINGICQRLMHPIYNDPCAEEISVVCRRLVGRAMTAHDALLGLNVSESHTLLQRARELKARFQD